MFMVHSTRQLEYLLDQPFLMLKTQELNQLCYILHSRLSSNMFTYCSWIFYKYLSLL
jgi:hypothetical protein